MTTDTHEPNKPSRFKYILLKPRSAKALSAVSIAAMWLWFLLKLHLTDEQTGVQALVGLCALIGLIGCIVMFLCTYNFVANAPASQLDERELADPNAAYFKAYQYAVILLLVGYLGTDFLARLFDFQVTPSVTQNFFLLGFMTVLITPATILAWRDEDLG
jgi:hypothetical protein